VARRRRLAAILFIAVLTVPAATLLLRREGGEPRRRSAIVIDSLYEWIPNDSLLNYLRDALTEAGYNVTVVKGGEATVDAYRNLTSYDLVILRSHGAYFKPGDVLGGSALVDYAPLVFTGERFSECLPLSCRYYFERLSDEVVGGEFQYEGGGARVFALTPIFFRNLKGEFREGAVVVLSSCYGLSGSLLADAFLSKGAAIFISWDWKVSAGTMDEALRMLVELVVKGGKSWAEAATTVSSEVGADPLGGGRLSFKTRSSPG